MPVCTCKLCIRAIAHASIAYAEENPFPTDSYDGGLCPIN